IVMRRTLLTMMVLAGCSDPSAAEAPAPVQPTTVSPPDPPREPPPAEAPPLTDRELDAMDEPALEAACFAGSSAASWLGARFASAQPELRALLTDRRSPSPVSCRGLYWFGARFASARAELRAVLTGRCSPSPVSRPG